MPRESDELKYGLALKHVPLVGPVSARQLISYCGGTQAVFQESRTKLEKIPGIGSAVAKSVWQFKEMQKVEKELDYIEKHNIQTAFYHEKNFPTRLKNIPDAPLLIFYKGKAHIDNHRLIGIVGTRKPTAYGKEWLTELLIQLKEYRCGIVSGLAYGIDALAHRRSLENDLETIAILGHGLDRIYPAQNEFLARQMLHSKGTLLTEFPIDTLPDRENFPKRNRIVAGMVDGLLVVETKNEGGSMITASLAFQYNRDVMALPGRVADTKSAGCNSLIKSNKAQLVENAEDIIKTLNWDLQLVAEKKQQVSLFQELNHEQKKVYDQLEDARKMTLDQLCTATQIAYSKLAKLLLELEMMGMIRSLPGKVYEIA